MGLLNRRKFLAVGTTVAAAGVVAVTVASAADGGKSDRQRRFVEHSGDLWGDRGRQAALHAVAGDMDPDDLYCALNLRGSPSHPRFLFELPNDAKVRTFSPTGEVA